jgi:hypothetical protein
MNLLKKYLIVGFIFISIFSLKSQGNLPYYDDRPYNFGFFVGLNTMDFGVELSYLEMPEGIYLAEVSSLMPGFTAGIIGNLRLNRYFGLRFSPSINFTERALTYRLADETNTIQENVFSIPLMLPLHVKYSAERIHNFRPYLLAGGGVYFDFGRDKERNILLRPFDYYVEFGTGCDIYFPFFKFSPELKFAIGFNNMLTPTEERVTGTFDARYTNALSRLTTKMITLSFNFE